MREMGPGLDRESTCHQKLRRNKETEAEWNERDARAETRRAEEMNVRLQLVGKQKLCGCAGI
jgi:hypothetical protein